MKSLFFKDPLSGTQITWAQLIGDLNGTPPAKSPENPEEAAAILKLLIFSLLTGKPLTLPYSQKGDPIPAPPHEGANPSNTHRDSPLTLLGKSDLIQRLKNPPKGWRLTLFSSGTTGKPHPTLHDFSSLTRFTKMGSAHTQKVWGLAYPLDRMAGIQVVLQALLNGNPLINLWGLNPEKIGEEIQTLGITHISGTPTFFRLLAAGISPQPGVERITCGGEILKDRTLAMIQGIFPQAKITNVYASTEFGSIFASKNGIFEVSKNMEPHVRIENEELILSNGLLSGGKTGPLEWIPTGDKVETLSTHPLKFRFSHRSDDLINLGGYKINPYEVEDALLTLPFISLARVYSKENSVMGNILCCEVVVNGEGISEAKIRAGLKGLLKEYQIPRLFGFVNKISTTPSGKIIRQG